MDVSLVIPAYNEAESLEELLPEALQELSKMGRSFEIIVADDASTDATPDIVAKYIKIDPRIRLVSLPSNSMKAGALAAGFGVSSGNYIITIDGDLQDEPANVAILLRALEEGADAVIGWKRQRRAPIDRKISSFAFNMVCRLLFGTPFHDMNSGMKAYRRQVIADVPLQGSLFRFGPIFLVACGWRVVEVPVSHRPRKFGSSKFGTSHRCRGIADLIRVKMMLRGGAPKRSGVTSRLS